MKTEPHIGSSNGRTPIWVPPWRYAEGWLICLGLLIVGFGLQWAGGGLNPGALAWPVNLYVTLIFSGVLLVSFLFARDVPFIAWLGRVPAAICSIALITFLVMIMGFVLQDDEAAAPWIRRLGLSSMTSSWPFLFAMFFFLAALGMATLKRLIPFKGRNVGFLLNHLGLYVAVMGGLMGAPDVERLLMELREGEVVWHATDDDGHVYEMPLAMELIRFEKEEYHPKAALVETETHRMVSDSFLEMFEIHAGTESPLGPWDVEVLRFHALSMPVGERYEPVMDLGSGPAALVRVTHRESGEMQEDWITCGSFAFPHQLLALNDEISLAMTVPRASAYRSQVVLYTPNREAEQIIIEVNKPYAVDGWKLYQYSYDDRFGRWSRTSIIELIRDPWLPVVYTGIFMLLAGSIYLMFKGRKADAPNGKGEGHAFV
jgi:hypothetical protein